MTKKQKLKENRDTKKLHPFISSHVRQSEWPQGEVTHKMDKKSKNFSWFFKSFLDWVAQVVIGILPHAPGANGIKRWMMIRRGAKIGNRIQVLSGLWVDAFHRLEMGDDVSIAHNVTLIASGGLILGHRCMIGAHTVIVTESHHIPSDRSPMRFSSPLRKKVILEDDVWVGANATILPGITIGKGAVVGAGSVVTKDVQSYCIVGGVPAEPIRMRE